MLQLYETIESLCKDNGVNITEMCKGAGVPRSAISDYKTGRKKTISIVNMQKIAEYFGVSIDYLLGKEKSPSEKTDRLNEDDIKIALFGGDDEVTDAMWEEAKNYAAYIKERERKKLK